MLNKIKINPASKFLVTTIKSYLFLLLATIQIQIIKIGNFSNSKISSHPLRQIAIPLIFTQINM